MITRTLTWPELLWLVVIAGGLVVGTRGLLRALAAERARVALGENGGVQEVNHMNRRDELFRLATMAFMFLVGLSRAFRVNAPLTPIITVDYVVMTFAVALLPIQSALAQRQHPKIAARIRAQKRAAHGEG